MVAAADSTRTMRTIMMTSGLDPEQRLAAAVILCALDDAREIDRVAYRAEARKWFGSEYCLFWFAALMPNAEEQWHQFCQQAVALIEGSE